MSEETYEQYYPHLFSKLKVRGRIIKNRVIAAPVARPFAMDKDEFINERGMRSFGEIVKGGTAVVTLGEAKLDNANSKAHSLHYECRDPDVIRRYHFFTEYVHAYGALASMELNHDGQFSNPAFNPGHLGPMGASELIMPDGTFVREMTTKDMEEVAESYAQAALIAHRSGFDMILLHFAHGWLMGGFLSPLINHRTDEYGGSHENRMRFPLAVIHRIREVAGEDLIIEVRLSGCEFSEGGIEIEDAVEYAKILDRDGNIDLIHMSAGTRFDGNTRPITHPSHFIKPCHTAVFSQRVKEAGVKLPVGIVGAVSDPELAEQLIAEGKADYVVMARQLMADPDWANKAKHGQTDQIRECLRCLHCFDSHRVNTGSAVLDDKKGTLLSLCDINPTFGHGSMVGEIPYPQKKKRVIVLGGGPAGLTAAAEAAKRGHDVELHEQSSELGGLLRLYTDQVWFKTQEAKYKDFMIRQVYEHGVKVFLNSNPSPEELRKKHPDTLFIAIGGKALLPQIDTEKGSHTINAIGIYRREDKLGDRVVILGGGSSGCEAALHLANLGKQVTVLEKGKLLLPNECFSNRIHTLKYMDDHPNITSLADQNVTKITPDGVITEEEDGTARLIPADTVVYATGWTDRIEAAEKYEKAAIDVVFIGDCRRSGTIGTAIHDGYRAAATIYAE